MEGDAMVKMTGKLNLDGAFGEFPRMKNLYHEGIVIGTATIDKLGNFEITYHKRFAYVLESGK